MDFPKPCRYVHYGVMQPSAAELARVRALCLSGEARRIRQTANVSQSVIGSECGPVGAPTVHRWETGQQLPRGEQAMLYAAVLRRLRRVARSVPA